MKLFVTKFGIISFIIYLPTMFIISNRFTSTQDVNGLYAPAEISMMDYITNQIFYSVILSSITVLLALFISYSNIAHKKTSIEKIHF